MDLFFPSGVHLAAFLLACLMLAVTPGPGVFYIVTRSVAQGRGVGLASVLGVAIGNFGNALAAALGLAALFAISDLVFGIVKYAGAGYLIYLGLQTWRAREATGPSGLPEPSSLGRVFRDGIFVALFNPKTTLFFAAFLPQFLVAERNATSQSIALGTVFVVVACVTDSIYAMASGTLAPRLSANGNWAQWGCLGSGLAFIGLGLFTAFGGPQRSK